MLAKCYSCALNGVNAIGVEIEVFSAIGTSQFAIVGLPDTAVKEAKDRIPTALKNQGLSTSREVDITVNLAPADIRKEGPIYDLPIAICLLRATGKVRNSHLEDYAMVGELALSGEVRRVRGILPMVLEMKRLGKSHFIVPYENAEEASIVSGINVIPVKVLQEAVQYLNGEREIAACQSDLLEKIMDAQDCADDFSDVKGQEQAKRAIEVAVAGGHNLLMLGSPGAGKTMLARRIPSILPPLTVGEALEIAKIHSVVGIAKGYSGLVAQRPFRAPHHTVSSIGLLGGGAHPVPGEVSLAHRGVLFLDEFAEFPRNALEVLRQPLEDGHVVVSRASAAYDFPSKFMLVAAMNPCPCGYYNDDAHVCRCSHNAIVKYQSRVSGPLLDRIDIQIEVPPLDVKKLPFMERGESSRSIRARIVRAREVQRKRYENMPSVLTNADVKSRDLPEICKLTTAKKEMLVRLIERLHLSARAYDKVLRISRTLADLAGQDEVGETEIMEAVGYRRLDNEEKSFWI